MAVLPHGQLQASVPEQVSSLQCHTVERVVLVIFTGTVYRPDRSMGAPILTPDVVTGAPVMTLAVTTGGEGVLASV